MARSDVLPSSCFICRQPFQDFEEAQSIPRPMVVKRGEKSGVLGLYPHPRYQDEEEDVVHHWHCAMKYFHPEENGEIYDLLCQEIEANRTKEIREEEREELQDKMGRILGAAARDEVLPNTCRECWDDLEDDDPVMCIFCKLDECVWECRTRRGTFYNCGACGKRWNQDEVELAA